MQLQKAVFAPVRYALIAKFDGNDAREWAGGTQSVPPPGGRLRQDDSLRERSRLAISSKAWRKAEPVVVSAGARKATV